MGGVLTVLHDYRLRCVHPQFHTSSSLLDCCVPQALTSTYVFCCKVWTLTTDFVLLLRTRPTHTTTPPPNLGALTRSHAHHPPPPTYNISIPKITTASKTFLTTAQLSTHTHFWPTRISSPTPCTRTLPTRSTLCMNTTTQASRYTLRHHNDSRLNTQNGTLAWWGGPDYTLLQPLPQHLSLPTRATQPLGRWSGIVH